MVAGSCTGRHAGLLRAVPERQRDSRFPAHGAHPDGAAAFGRGLPADQRQHPDAAPGSMAALVLGSTRHAVEFGRRHAVPPLSAYRPGISGRRRTNHGLAGGSQPAASGNRRGRSPLASPQGAGVVFSHFAGSNCGRSALSVYPAHFHTRAVSGGGVFSIPRR